MSDAEPRLLLVVGLTGVGKSTVVDMLVARHGDLRLLPNRRELTDEIIIPDVQRREGRDPARVRDRVERFRLTAAYREVHPGGMTHALRRWLDAHGPSAPGSDIEPGGTLLFDNLRGVAEVRAAHDAFPAARFLVLDASPRTRLARLIGRADPFDHAGVPTAGAARATAPVERDARERLRAIEGLADVFDLDELTHAATRGGVDLDALESAARIIAEEQRNYDSAAAIGFLEAHVPPTRRRIVDTEIVAPGETADRVLAWLEPMQRHP